MLVKDLWTSGTDKFGKYHFGCRIDRSGQRWKKQAARSLLH